MHFDPRTQDALRAVGLDDDDLERASTLVAEAVERDAAELTAFVDAHETLYSDMDLAHGASDVHEHAVDYLDVYTHAADLRGYLRFDSWGVYVEGGRPLSGTKIELTLGPTVNDRVRFATDPDELR